MALHGMLQAAGFPPVAFGLAPSVLAGVFDRPFGGRADAQRVRRGGRDG